ncbi:MAG: glucose-6-phosphate dehydrogenase, partial [Gaiellaceae bacterium]
MEARAEPGYHALSGPGRPAPPCTVVIFGAAGDLTKRKLLPALYNLKVLGLLPKEFVIAGVARKEKTHEQFREEQTQSIREFATTRVDETLWAELRAAMYYQAGELSDPAVYTQLADLLAEVAKRHGTGGSALFYLAIPPSLFGEVVRRLGEAGLVRQEGDAWRRVIVEKPFGHDLTSARELNELVRSHFDEDEIFRIDHYLGKETVQNMLVLRFANGI